MPSLLQDFGQGLRGAGAVLSPGVYQAQQQQGLMQERAQLQRNNEMAQLIVRGIQSGDINPDAGQAALQHLGFGGMRGLVGPSGAAQATARLRAALANAPAGSNPSAILSEVNPIDALTSPAGQALIKWAALSEQQRSIEEYRKAAIAARDAALNKPFTVISGDQEIQYMRTPQGLVELGRGPRFARQVAPTVNVTTAPPLPPGALPTLPKGQKWQTGVANGGQDQVAVDVQAGIARKLDPSTGTWKPTSYPKDWAATGKAPQAATTRLSADDLKTITWGDLSGHYGLPLSGPALQLASYQAYFTGRLPYLGFSSKGSAANARLALLDGEAKVAAELGQSPAQAASTPAGYRALTATLEALQKKHGMLDAILGSFHNNIATYEAAAKGKPPPLAGARIKALGNAFKAIDFSDPVTGLNKAKLAISRYVSDPATVAYLTSAITVAMDYARILSSQGQSAAQVSDSARSEALKLINVGYDAKAREALIGTLESDTAGQMKGITDSIQNVQGMLRNPSASPTSATRPGSETGAPQGPKEGQRSTSKSGRPIIYQNGAWHYAD